jgi:CP family cyanate transporter-like MFS transporter
MNYRLLIVIVGGFCSAGSFWMFLPLLSLSLRAEGASDALVGVMSGLPWAGLLAVSVFIPRIIHRIGLQRMVLVGMALGIAVFLGFSATRNIYLWAALTLALGMSLGLRWAGLDTWINGSVPNHLRGRLIGAYELIMSGSMAVGPALLALIGSAGAKPFLVAAAVMCGAMALLASVGREASGMTEAPGKTRALDVLRAEPASFTGIALVGMSEACNLSLLPVMGLGLGLAVHWAALLVVVCQAGVAAGAVICGTLSDKLNRRALKLATGAIMATLPLAVPLCIHSHAVWPVLAVWGVAQGGLFTVGMVKLGTRFSGTALARAMSLAMVIYTVGGLVGPPVMGGMMAVFGPAGLVYGLAALSAVGVVFMALRRVN